MSEPATLCEKLDWDSSLFGISIARVRPGHLDRATCRAVLDWCRTERIDCLYFLAVTDDDDTRRQMGEAGFIRVDERVTLELRPASPSVAVPRDARPARPEDISALRAIAAVSHHDSRFYNDGGFTRDKCDELYRVWIEKSCRGWADHVVVVERQSTAIGYLTVHLKSPHTAAIGLVGVEPSFRRQGIGRRLLDGALAWTASQSVTCVSVVTQGRNAASQGFFQNAGFRPAGAAVWYHRWFRPPGIAR